MKQLSSEQKNNMKVYSFIKKSIVSILFMSMLFYSCQNDMQLITEYMSEENIPVEQLKQVEYLYTENGIVKSKMSCGVLKRFNTQQKYTEFSEGFVIEMFDSLGTLTSTISANYAKRLEDTQIFEAQFNVEVIDAVEKKILNTEHLFWDERKQRIYTDKFVKITTPDKIIFGEGFESDENFSDYYIKRPKGEILVTRKEE
jgi:LPS export ABC transporter protein LptC